MKKPKVSQFDDLVPKIVRILGLTQELAEVPPGTSGRTELEYRSAWARTYLGKAGLLENSERGIWALTPKGSQDEPVDGPQLARDVAKVFQAERADAADGAEPASASEADAPVTWQDRLNTVLQSMDPIAVERLCQRILPESGFIEVDVTAESAHHLLGTASLLE